MVYAVITEDGIDQVCETEEDAKREAKDLRQMGCRVKIKTFETAKEVDEYEDKLRGY